MLSALLFALFELIIPAIGINAAFHEENKAPVASLAMGISIIVVFFITYLAFRRIRNRAIPRIYGRDPRVLDVSLVATSLMTLFAIFPPRNTLEWLLLGASLIGTTLTPLLMQVENNNQQPPLPDGNAFVIYARMLKELKRRAEYCCLAILLLPIVSLVALIIAQPFS